MKANIPADGISPGMLATLFAAFVMKDKPVEEMTVSMTKDDIDRVNGYGLSLFVDRDSGTVEVNIRAMTSEDL
jgi:hypothetical protein